MRITFVAAGAVVSLLCLLGEHATAESQISQISQIGQISQISQISQIKAVGGLLKLARGTRFGKALGPSLEPALKTSDAAWLIIYGDLIQTGSKAKIDVRQMFLAAGVPDDQTGLLVDPAYVQRQLSQLGERWANEALAPMSAREQLILIETLPEEPQQFLARLRQGGVPLGEARSLPLRSLQNPPQQLGDEVELLEMYERMLKEHRPPAKAVVRPPPREVVLVAPPAEHHGADWTVELCVKSNGELSVAVSYHELTMSFATRGKVTLSATSPDGTKTATVSSSLHP